VFAQVRVLVAGRTGQRVQKQAVNPRHVGEDHALFRIEMLPNHVVPAQVCAYQLAMRGLDREARRRGIQSLTGSAAASESCGSHFNAHLLALLELVLKCRGDSLDVRTVELADDDRLRGVEGPAVRVGAFDVDGLVVLHVAK
jgi:hypothetical protein